MNCYFISLKIWINFFLISHLILPSADSWSSGLSSTRAWSSGLLWQCPADRRQCWGTWWAPRSPSSSFLSCATRAAGCCRPSQPPGSRPSGRLWPPSASCSSASRRARRPPRRPGIGTWTRSCRSSWAFWMCVVDTLNGGCCQVGIECLDLHNRPHRTKWVKWGRRLVPGCRCCRSLNKAVFLWDLNKMLLLFYFNSFFLINTVPWICNSLTGSKDQNF